MGIAIVLIVIIVVIIALLIYFGFQSSSNGSSKQSTRGVVNSTEALTGTGVLNYVITQGSIQYFNGGFIIPASGCYDIAFKANMQGSSRAALVVEVGSQTTPPMGIIVIGPKDGSFTQSSVTRVTLNKGDIVTSAYDITGSYMATGTEIVITPC